ncbi:uncharacterized protein LOC123718382 [Pieris brassicae]|uniref:uncharacterized protein LOC123718382 n=1 Tax=Pieris brassicae TaxID=7116 RepID=UPI001E65F473|nr:uncharacterized protein LOC123718382 [Pieris brassicae]
MEGNEGGGLDPPNSKKRPRRRLEDPQNVSDAGGGGGEKDSYIPYLKPNYKRLYPENSINMEFKVFIENKNIQDRLGNKSPIYLNHIFSEIKGVVAIRRISANKIVVIFKQHNTANNLIHNIHFLEKHDMKAYIPAAQIEKTGIIRFVPASISNKELFTKLTSTNEIIAVRRFMKKIGNELVGTQTVSITFLANSLPESVQYDLFFYRVFEYIPPLQQCFKCMKFNHYAKICNGKQRCSICSGEHSYKDCNKQNEICCVNCSGPHLAISKMCPIKMNKILEKKNKITYASIASTKDNNEFPPLPPRSNPVNKKVISVNNAPKYVNKSINIKPVSQAVSINDIKSQIIANSDVLMALVQTLVQIGNKNDNEPITTTFIKDILIKNLSI